MLQLLGVEQPLQRYTGDEVSKIRHAIGITQQNFWPVFGCSQPDGSRYETGSKVAKPVIVLLNLAFGPAEVRDEILQQAAAEEATA